MDNIPDEAFKGALAIVLDTQMQIVLMIKDLKKQILL